MQIFSGKILGIFMRKMPHLCYIYVSFQPFRPASFSISAYSLSKTPNVVCGGSPSRIRSVLRISFGITTRPKSSILLTIPVAFICSILLPKLLYSRGYIKAAAKGQCPKGCLTGAITGNRRRTSVPSAVSFVKIVFAGKNELCTLKRHVKNWKRKQTKQLFNPVIPPLHSSMRCQRWLIPKKTGNVSGMSLYQLGLL